MKKEELKQLQNELDIIKWNDSQALGGLDTCGSYDYCALCDKAVEYPCAKAKTAQGKQAAKAKSDKIIRARKPRAKKAQ